MVPPDDLLRHAPLGAPGVLRKASRQRHVKDDGDRRPPSRARQRQQRATSLRRQVRGVDDRAQAAAQPGTRSQVEESEGIGACALVCCVTTDHLAEGIRREDLGGRELPCRPC